MAEYRLSNEAREDLIRIHHFGVKQFGMTQPDKYFETFFDHFEMIAENPFAFESVEHIKSGYRKCPCGSDTIYFRLIDTRVEIMAIVGMQDLKNML